LKTDWEKVDHWYDQIVGEEGHYYHRQVILPKLLPLLTLKNYQSPALLDLACGQGILAAHLPTNCFYVGVDLAPSLINQAKKRRKLPQQNFFVGNICEPLPVQKKDFSHATIILALQNIEYPDQALIQAANHLKRDGLLAIVLNHPCFRIPRQSGWVIDEEKKLQSRKIDRYLTPMSIPIQMHPGKAAASEMTWSFHHSLSDYSRFLAQAGFVIQLIEEWTSDKTTTGKKAKMENRARDEFPLFLTIIAKKL
jgi:ubiquinone/menaquinone biosynthesis C-methylase UbiE